MNQEIKATQSVPPRGSESREFLAAQVDSLNRECRRLRDRNDDLERRLRESHEEVGRYMSDLKAAKQRAEAAERKASDLAKAEPVSIEGYRDVLRDKLFVHVTASLERQNPCRDGRPETETLVEFDCDIDTVLVDHEDYFDFDLPIPTLVSLTVPTGVVDAEIECHLLSVLPPNSYRRLRAEFGVDVIGPA